MKKTLPLIILAAVAITLAWCWKQETTEIIEWKKELSFSKYYELSWNGKYDLNLYWNIVSDNIKNITSTRSWKISYLNCQPWTKVNKNTLIATITPDFSDPNIQNTEIQKKSLRDQIKNLQDTITSTNSNYSLQIDQLKNQKNNNNNQIRILSENLEIQRKQRDYSSWDISVQISSLEDQIQSLKNQRELLKESKEKDLNKIYSSISNQRKQIQNYTTNYFETIDQVFGITEKNKTYNDNFETYLSAKNSNQKEEVKTKFSNLQAKLTNINSLSNEWLLEYMEEVSLLLKTAADSVNNSISSTTFSQTTIDTYYSTLIAASNNILSLKSNLDSSNNSIKTTSNSYENQISTLTSNIDTYQKNLENLKANKWNSAILSIDNWINSLISQIENYKSTNTNLDNQINWLLEQKNIQINSLNNQLLSLKQSISTLDNSASWESINAWINWIIKAKKIDQDNKIWANTLICQISPNETDNLKVQIYSSQKLDIWQSYEIYKDWKKIMESKIDYELPFIDPTTQNYVYENKLNTKEIKDWDKVDVKLSTAQKTGNITIPLDFALPKLEWYFVNKCTNKDCKEAKEVQISVWEINNWYIEVLSWITQWDKIAK